MEFNGRQFLDSMQLLCWNMDHNFWINGLEVEWLQCQAVVVHSVNHFAVNLNLVIVRLHLEVELQRLELKVLVLYSHSLDCVLLNAHYSPCISQSHGSFLNQWKDIAVGIEAALFLNTLQDLRTHMFVAYQNVFIRTLFLQERHSHKCYSVPRTRRSRRGKIKTIKFDLVVQNKHLGDRFSNSGEGKGHLRFSRSFKF